MIPNKWTFRNKDKVIDLSTVESGVYVLDHSDTGLPEVRSELRPRIDLIGSTSSGNRYEARRFVLVVRITSKSPVENMRKLRRLLDDMNPMNKAGIISDGVMSRLSPDGVELNIKCRLINGFDLQARHRRQSTWTYTAPFVFLAEDPRWYTVHPKTVEETVVKTGLMTGSLPGFGDVSFGYEGTGVLAVLDYQGDFPSEDIEITARGKVSNLFVANLNEDRLSSVGFNLSQANGLVYSQGELFNEGNDGVVVRETATGVNLSGKILGSSRRLILVPGQNSILVGGFASLDSSVSMRYYERIGATS